MTSLTKKDKKFTREQECKKSFQTLKYCLTTVLVLILLQGVEGFVIYIDASNQSYEAFFM